eukprot:s12055_g1.t1
MLTAWEEAWKRANYVRATVAIGVDEEKANGLWTGIVLHNNKDASEDEIKSEDVEQRLRKSSRLADASATFQEKAQSAWQEMMKVKSADDGADGAGPGAGAGSWTVTNELMQLVKKRKAAQQKVEEKKKTEAMTAEEQQGEKEKLRLQKKKIMNPFFLDFKAVEKAKVITDAD